MNPGCSKCSIALDAFDEAGVEYTVRRYLDDPPTAAELRDVLARLGLEPWDITRTGEQIAEDLAIDDWPRDAVTRDHWIGALAANPVLIQRPTITADDGTTVIGRTPEALSEVLT